MREKYYFSAREAAAELESRRIKGLHKDVEERFKLKGWPFPNLPSGNLGVLVRQVATVRYEDLFFMEMAKAVSLCPIWPEYTSDKFVSSSRFKKSLLHPFFCSGKGRNNGWVVTKKKLSCVVSWDGRKLSDIRIKNNTISLVDYHHNLRDRFIPGVIRTEMSDFLDCFLGAAGYYQAYLSLFVAHGVLFEDYHGGESGCALNSFTENVFQPAWESVTKEFGMRPLITPLPWLDGMQFYPANHNWMNHGVFDKHSIEMAIR